MIIFVVAFFMCKSVYIYSFLGFYIMSRNALPGLMDVRAISLALPGLIEGFVGKVRHLLVRLRRSPSGKVIRRLSSK